MGDDGAADRSFASAIELLRQLRLPERLRECAIEYADLLQRQGRLEDSIVYWRIAAGADAQSMTRPSEQPASAAGSSA
jgi:hypothetical protein